MWYLELLVYAVSVLAFSSVLLPWSIMTKEYTIEPDCKLPTGFQFKLWGTACGITWEEYKNIHQNSYFAFVNIVQKTRVINLVVAIISGLLVIYVTFKGAKKEVLLMVSLIMSVTTVVNLSGYVNEMETTMTLPVEYLFIQGPGYLVSMVSASLSGSIFFTEFFVNFYKLHYCEHPRVERSKCNLLAYLISIISIFAIFGDLMRVEKCKDYVTPIDLNTCPACNSPLVPTVTIFGVLALLAGVTLYITTKFFYDYTLLNNVMALFNLSMLVVVIVLTFMFENFKNAGFGMYALFIGVVFDLVFIMTYNFNVALVYNVMSNLCKFKQ